MQKYKLNEKIIFHANSKLELIEMITDLCGTASTSDWPEVRELPLYPTIEMKPSK